MNHSGLCPDCGAHNEPDTTEPVEGGVWCGYTCALCGAEWTTAYWHPVLRWEAKGADKTT